MSRPKMPTFEDESRAIHQASRLAILLDEWDEIESEWLEDHIGAERSQVWGIPDTSANPLADLSRQLSTPGLYGIRPEFKRPDGAGDDLVGTEGAMERAGFYTKMQFVQYLVLGLSDLFLRFDVTGRGELVVRLVWPSDVYLRAPVNDPGNANELWQLTTRWMADEKVSIYTWEVWKLGRVARSGEVIEEPSYAIHRAEEGTLSANAAFRAGGLGEDLSHRFVERFDGTFGRLEGVDYPWRTEAGIPVFPHVHYQDADTGMLWNTFLKRGVHKGTLNTGLFWTYAGHCARDATGSYVIIAGLDEGSHTVFSGNGRGGANSNPVDGSVSIKVKLITPGAMEHFNIKDGQTPFVHEVGPGANLDMVRGFADHYEMKQATRWGLNPSDLARTAANPTSAAALMVGNQGKREFSAQVTPIFRRKDLESIETAAIVIRAAGGPVYPERGYSTQYFQIPKTPAEQAEQRDQLTWEKEEGQLSELDLYRKLHPGTTEADAMVALVKVASDDATLQAAIDAELAKLGTDEAPATSGGDAAQDSALNGAQTAQLLEIVASMNRGDISLDQAANIVSRAFLLSGSQARVLVGSVEPISTEPLPDSTNAAEE
ncbi:MAG: hypothetical protein HRU00_14120 [Myxococcales bacterium]|nr:hypothetical protein [Myxococcales bacterium]